MATQQAYGVCCCGVAVVAAVNLSGWHTLMGGRKVYGTVRYGTVLYCYVVHRWRLAGPYRHRSMEAQVRALINSIAFWYNTSSYVVAVIVVS